MEENRERDDEEKSAGFSFSFAKKKKEPKQLEHKTLGDVETAKKKNETDFILSVDKNTIKSVKPTEEPKALVIPLIKRNLWQSQKSYREDDEGQKRSAESSGQSEPASKKRKDEAKVEAGDALENEAVKEIMKDVSRYNEEWDTRGTEDQNMTIPLLMQNKVPEGFETDDKLDVSIRPDQASDVNYEEVPIEQFGMAMLRGMGFNDKEGIGGKMKKSVAPVEVVVRPKGQGLGADRRPGDALIQKRKQKRKPGDPAPKEEEEPRGFTKGAPILVTSGSHKNLYGLIEGVDEDSSRVIIKFTLSNQVATLSQFAVQLVTKEEYKKCSKDLGKFSKGHDELKKREEEKSRDSSGSESRRHKHRDREDRSSRRDKEDRHRHSKNDRSAADDDDNNDNDRYDDRKKGHHSDKHSDRHKHSKKDKSRDADDDYYERRKNDDDRDHRGNRDRPRDGKKSERRREEREEPKSSKHRTDHDRHRSNDVGSEKATYWLRPDLRVRIIDATYKKGKYYNTKVKIVDVITRDSCTCQTDDGRFLEDINQSMVETLIPRADPPYIMVVTGKLKGQIGLVVKKDKTNCKASVQLLQDRETIVKLDYDIICEYAGNIHDEDDY